MAWLCSGDFNEILHQKEKMGGASRPYKQIEEFRQAVDFCGLNDIHSQGLSFTWSNNRFGREFTKETIDKALGNKEWNDLFNHGSCTALAAVKSDHSPLLIETCRTNQKRRRRRVCFRYEMAWELKEDYQKVISEAWKRDNRSGCEASVLRKKLDACQQELLVWKQKTKKQQDMTITQGLQSIGHLQETGSGSHLASMKQAQEDVVSSMTEYDLKWHQRAKQHWLKHGDRNTHYVHMQASQRRKTNTIKRVEASQGMIVTEQAEIGGVFIGYFSSLFASTQPSNSENYLFALGTKLDSEMQAWLMIPFNKENITKAIFQMNPLGSPGPDEFPVQFYQKHWEVWVSRGLRQGHPLSSYLFILCAEALTALLNQAEACGGLTLVPIGRGPVSVNHLFFADDSLLFCKAKAEELRYVLNILDIYEKASGQVINKDKSSIFFSRNTGHAVQQQILELAGVKSSGTFERYLGLPTLVGRAKVASFHSLIDRTWSRVTNWKNKFLSATGKKVLLKAVLQAIPTYAMGMFMIPLSITSKLNQLLRKFWWGFNEDSSKIQWANWKQLSYSKDMGGLGFRDLRSFNLALLSKQGWRILQNPNSLVGRVLKQKYFSKVGFLEAKVGTGPSFAWRGIHASLRLLKEGLIWRVGNGQQVNIWLDKWLPFSPPYKIQSIRDVDCWCEKGQGVKKVQKLSFQRDLIFDIWSRLVEILSLEELEEVAATMRGIWTRRNNTIHGKEFKHPNALHQLAKAELVSYREALTEDLGVKLTDHVRTPRWSKPDVGSYKVNWDAAVNQKEGKIGIGVLIRDHHGYFIGGLQAHRSLKGTRFDAEAYGMLLAAVFYKEVGITHLCLEGDSKKVVDLLKHYTKNWSLGGCLVEDAREILNSYACWSVAHTY
ncbi:uncharacterized protein LOC121242200 [Juglans microcarpa x Juglans regia]|uniref:uncharacterized protein LOC121242200 n=1 Tax=Juglans microcarpa x Juglans regia TaxID=2249226 RepID=UPI001B7D9168|nr:uncharacterized protein LOC121242200 [Juglans microcarpa x Juglans regia]